MLTVDRNQYILPPLRNKMDLVRHSLPSVDNIALESFVHQARNNVIRMITSGELGDGGIFRFADENEFTTAEVLSLVGKITRDLIKAKRAGTTKNVSFQLLPQRNSRLLKVLVLK